MCRNNVPDDVLAESPELKQWESPKVPRVNWKWHRDSSDED